ncbi:MAG: RNA ligase family protein [Dehalococcoidia bacterium]
MSAFPEWVEPMAATLTQERFIGPEWVFERKLDGIRVLAFKRGPDVRLLSRNRLLQNDAYPKVVEAITALPVREAILDGEATGVWGRRGDATYHVFDVTWLEGRNVCGLPLDERRALLERIALRPPLALVERLDDTEPWERACNEGWEGVIAKRRDAPYEHRRSPHWLKMKCEATQELVVGGFTDPQGARVGLGALLVGYYADGDFVYAGRVGTGTGLGPRRLLELRAQLDALEVAACPFTAGEGLPRGAHWVQPSVVVQVAFIEWTRHGKMRHPRLLGVRTDKQAAEVVREMP